MIFVEKLWSFRHFYMFKVKCHDNKMQWDLLSKSQVTIFTILFFSPDVLEIQTSRQYLLASSALDGRLIIWSQDAKLASVAPESKKDPAAPKDTNPFKDLFAAKRMTLTTDHIVIIFWAFNSSSFQIKVIEPSGFGCKLNFSKCVPNP